MDTNFIEVNLPCPDCGSSDALALNEDGSTKCFSCGTFDPIANREAADNMTTEKKTTRPNPHGFIKGEALPIVPRGLHLHTCKK